MDAKFDQDRHKPTKILVAFGSRADAGLLLPVAVGIQQHECFECLTIAIDGDGKLMEVLEEAKFVPNAILKFDVLAQERDSKVAVAKAMGQIITKSSDLLVSLAPDIIIILGERYEIFALASAATALTIPIAHLCGGDVTLAANDEVFRHAISKMSHMHFPSNDTAANRLVSMGENSSNVYVIGNTSLDTMHSVNPLYREEFFEKVGLETNAKSILATFHPETLSGISPLDQIKPMLDAFSKLDETIGTLITAANLDAGGEEINEKISEFSDKYDHVKFYPNLGFKLYHSGLVHCDVVVGNSSSGLYEAPSFNCATVNIGSRQEGRLKASSVLDCKNDVSEILNAISTAFGLNCQDIENPYGDGHAVESMIPILISIKDPRGLLMKGFFEGEQE